MLQPLAERLRPKNLDEYIGQEHLVGPGAVLRRMIDAGKISSFILWGPPGVGKTTLAHIISQQLQAPFFTLSAVQSGVKEVREVIDRCKTNIFSKVRPILFIDEIHRFSKSQQDSLLGAVEYGTVTLIGATTENPSFEVIRPLLSRCQVYVLKSLEVKHLQLLLDRAIHSDIYLKERDIEVKETDALFRYSGGDARKLLNIIGRRERKSNHRRCDCNRTVTTKSCRLRQKRRNALRYHICIYQIHTWQRPGCRNLLACPHGRRR